MLNVCKYFLWSACNDYRFRDIVPSSGIVCAQVCARVRFHLPLLFKRFRSSRRRRYFVPYWMVSWLFTCDFAILLLYFAYVSSVYFGVVKLSLGVLWRC